MYSTSSLLSKKDLLIENPEEFPDILNAYEVIESLSDYDLDLVKEVYIATKKNTALAAGSALKPLVLCHIFFTDIALHFMEQLTALCSYNAFFIFNISEALARNVHFTDLLKGIFPDSIIISMPNKGRDIGGKLSALNLALQLNIDSDICLFIHDKKSQHIDAGELWRDELFKIIDPTQLPKVFQQFATDNETGIVCSKRYIQNEYIPDTGSFTCTSNKQLKYLIGKYEIDTKNYNFVAGTELTLTGNNLWLHTDYTGFDPESSSTNAASNADAFSGFTYPAVRSFLATINLTF